MGHEFEGHDEQSDQFIVIFYGSGGSGGQKSLQFTETNYILLEAAFSSPPKLTITSLVTLL